MFHILVFITIILPFDSLYAPIAHEVLPVSLVDSVTAKVDDEKKTLHTVYTCGIHHVIYFSNIFLYTFMLFLRAFYIDSTYIPYTLKVKMKVKKWRPEKLKMVKKHFFPEMFGDLWGVICYHHWYPRAGLEGREKSYFSKKVVRFKIMQNHP